MNFAANLGAIFDKKKTFRPKKKWVEPCKLATCLVSLHLKLMPLTDFLLELYVTHCTSRHRLLSIQELISEM